MSNYMKARIVNYKITYPAQIAVFQSNEIYNSVLPWNRAHKFGFEFFKVLYLHNQLFIFLTITNRTVFDFAFDTISIYELNIELSPRCYFYKIEQFAVLNMVRKIQFVVLTVESTELNPVCCVESRIHWNESSLFCWIHF